jgi:hypothetical protein
MMMNLLRLRLRFVAAVLVAAASLCGLARQTQAQQQTIRRAPRPAGWEAILKSELPVLGHRNWIVVADSAYPKQSAAGIRTVYTAAGQLDVLRKVLQEIEAAPHVQPLVLIDRELDSVPDDGAPGIDAYRKELRRCLQGKQVDVMPHEEIIGKLDEAAELFNILILKTDMVLPYTSVFIQLDCGYWNAEKEQALREAMK